MKAGTWYARHNREDRVPPKLRFPYDLAAQPEIESRISLASLIRPRTTAQAGPPAPAGRAGSNDARGSR